MVIGGGGGGGGMEGHVSEDTLNDVDITAGKRDVFLVDVSSNQYYLSNYASDIF